MKAKYWAASALIGAGAFFGGVGTAVAVKPHTVTCESFDVVVRPPVGMPGNDVFRICGRGMPDVGIYCPDGLPSPGGYVTCSVSRAKP